MVNQRGLTGTMVLNIMLMYCLVRFGLVFTSTISLFRIPFVLLAGAGVVFLYACVNPKYTGQFLQANLLCLVFNILSIGILNLFIKNTSDASNAANYLNQLLVLVALWGGYLYIRCQPRNIKKMVVGVYLLAVVVSAAYTCYVALDGNELIIRNTAFGQYDTRYPLTYGGFDFIYGLVVIYIALLITLVNGRECISRGKQILIIVLMVLFALTIITSSYSTAFVLVLLGTIFIAPKKHTTRAVLLVILILCLYVFPVPLTKFIESIPYMPELTSRRVNELILSFSGQGSAEYFTDDGQRLDRIMWSIDAFLNHPILGVLGSGDNVVLGGHTEWIEQLARYGIFTAIFNALFWVLTYRNMKRNTATNSGANKCITGTFFVYLLLGFLNPISMVVTSAPLFVFCPFVQELFEGQERNLTLNT